MKVGVISDTHDRLPTFERAMEVFERFEVEAIFHAGDYVAPFAAKLLGPERVSAAVYCIYGNNDGEREGLKNVLPGIVDGPLNVELAGRRIAMHHYLEWLDAADIANADVIISGHDHTPRIEHKSGQLFLNPGECCGWVNGRCTVAVLDLAGMEAELVDVGGGAVSNEL